MSLSFKALGEGTEDLLKLNLGCGSVKWARLPTLSSASVRENGGSYSDGCLFRKFKSPVSTFRTWAPIQMGSCGEGSHLIGSLANKQVETM